MVSQEYVEGVFVLHVADPENDVGDIIRQLIIRMNRPINQFTVFMRLQWFKIGIRFPCEIGKFSEYRYGITPFSTDRLDISLIDFF